MSAAILAQSANDLPPPVFLRQAQVLAMVPISDATLWRLVKVGRFPAPVKLSPNVTAWRSDEVRAWCAAIKPNKAN
jgi:prophage regulatory protein